ncbi:MAG: hypothetical protein LBE22_07690 [Azoarcus sp.]|jgi:hypothetical protein|nr:hypothetical protein [Azoarcus sp.]
MEYPVTAKLGVSANPHGAYLCLPDEVASFEDVKVKIIAKLLSLCDGRVAYGVDYEIEDGSSRGPIFWASSQTSPSGDRYSAIKGVKNILEEIYEKAEEKEIKQRTLGSLRDWIDNFDHTAWEAPSQVPAKLGRKPIEQELIDKPQIDEEETNALITKAAQMDGAARAVAVRIGYDLPADSTHPDLICRDIRANMNRSLESVLNIGRGLLVLKEVCGHGNFVSRTDELGIDRTLAKRFMLAAAKFSNGASTHHLLPKIDSQTKLFELLVLDDEQIDELAETGQTGELKLDDVACMGVRELRKAVRELRSKIDAKDKVAKSNQQTILNLQEQLAEIEVNEPENVDLGPDKPSFEALQAKLNKQVSIARGELLLVLVAITDLGRAMPNGPAYDAAKMAAWQTLLGDLRQYAISSETPLNLAQNTDEILIDENAKYVGE